MGWPVEWLKRMISAREFDMWCRYYQQRPFDDESVHQAQLALLTSVYVNGHREKGKAPTKASDFLIFRREDPAATAPDLDNKLRGFFARAMQTPNPA